MRSHYCRLVYVSLGLFVADIALSQIGSEGRRDKKRPRYEERAWQEETDSQMDEPSALFPAWPTPSFDWFLQPLIGARVENDDTGAEKRTSSVTELGLGLGLQGIPIVPGNPGFYLRPHAGYAAGTYNSQLKVTGVGTTTTNGSFTRMFYGSDLVLLVDFYRHTLGLTKGELKYAGDRKDKSNSIEVMNDMGVLVLDWFSTHLTLTYLSAYEKSPSKPTLTERDHWLHARMAFSFLNAHLDFGPGYSDVELFGLNNNGEREKVASGQTNYFLGVGGMDLFWKLGMSARAKYVYDAPVISQNAAKIVASERVPSQNLGEPSPITTLPEDSWDINLFFGLRNLFANLGFGWNYHVVILNYSEKDGKKKETYADQGVSVMYETAF